MQVRFFQYAVIQGLSLSCGAGTQDGPRGLSLIAKVDSAVGAGRAWLDGVAPHLEDGCVPHCGLITVSMWKEDSA
jgi:hypothetical protein